MTYSSRPTLPFGWRAFRSKKAKKPQPSFLSRATSNWMPQLGYGTILSDAGEVVYKWDVGTQNPSGRYLLQPGNYTVVYRSRSGAFHGLFTNETNQHPLRIYYTSLTQWLIHATSKPSRRRNPRIHAAALGKAFCKLAKPTKTLLHCAPI